MPIIKILVCNETRFAGLGPLTRRNLLGQRANFFYVVRRRFFFNNFYCVVKKKKENAAGINRFPSRKIFRVGIPTNVVSHLSFPKNTLLNNPKNTEEGVCIKYFQQLKGDNIVPLLTNKMSYISYVANLPTIRLPLHDSLLLVMAFGS